MLIERYFKVSGYEVEDFAVPPKYPDHPDVRFQVAGDMLATPMNVGDFFGTVMR